MSTLGDLTLGSGTLGDAFAIVAILVGIIEASSASISTSSTGSALGGEPAHSASTSTYASDDGAATERGGGAIPTEI